MPARRMMAVLLITSLYGGYTLSAAQEPPAACAERRGTLGELLTDARLKGDKVRLSALQERLQQLNERCRGMVPLQANQPEVERANQHANEREARLREALSNGNPKMIELRGEQLNEARRRLEEAKH